MNTASKINVLGDPNAVDSFAACLSAVMRAWAKDADYATIEALTGLAFSPCYNSCIYPPIRARTSFILTNTSSVADPAQICRETIRFGADIASGKITLARNTFGRAMYETVVSVSQQEHMCPGCQESGCLGRTFKRMHDGQQVSIAFLSAARPFIDGPENNKQLDTAIGYYSELRNLTAGYLDWASTEKKRDQPAFRQQLANDFTRAKALHDAAAEQLVSLAASI
ncbi:MAG: hypothetical protein JXA89_01915 [Anaerolineae bacterium]|nr:hypothetical protein [Anaerolineae bacterium]